MRIRLAVALIAVTSLAQAQFDACVPSLLPAATRLADIKDIVCGIGVQSPLYEAGSELRANVTIGLDADGAIRILQNVADSPLALVTNGASHAGRADSIYWGIWKQGLQRRVTDDKVSASESRTWIPYVAGVSSRSLPAGVADYKLLGAPYIVSSYNSANAPVAHSDNNSKVIEPGPISRADLHVDFDRGTATLKLRFSVRGIGGDATFALKRRKFPSLDFLMDSCDNAPVCPTASIRFYGRDAAQAGVLLTVYYDQAMVEAAKVSANLSNVIGTAAIALQRR